MTAAPTRPSSATATPSSPGIVEALPCPFCGTLPYVALKDRAAISCRNEECFGPRTTAEFLDDAIFQWNRRASQPVSAAQASPVAWRWRYRISRGEGWSRWIPQDDKTVTEFRKIQAHNLKGGLCELQPLYASPSPSISGALSEILKHVQAPNRPASERLDRIEAICVAGLAATTPTGAGEITEAMIKPGAAAMCCQAKTLGCAAKNKDSEFSTCMVGTFMEDARRCLAAAMSSTQPLPPDWKQDLAETSRLAPKSTEGK